MTRPRRIRLRGHEAPKKRPRRKVPTKVSAPGKGLPSRKWRAKVIDEVPRVDDGEVQIPETMDEILQEREVWLPFPTSNDHPHLCIYRVWRPDGDWGIDEYRAMLVAAVSATTAIYTHPNGIHRWDADIAQWRNQETDHTCDYTMTWPVNPIELNCHCLGRLATVALAGYPVPLEGTDPIIISSNYGA